MCACVCVCVSLAHVPVAVFTGKQFKYVVGLETVLLGHEDWVYSVRWQPPVTSMLLCITAM